MRSVALLLGLAAAGCGPDSAVCGDGVVQPGEDCDRGMLNGTVGQACSATCKSVSVKLVQIAVTWGFDLIGKGEPVPGYASPGCTNFGATKAHVLIDGPTPTDKIVDCARYTLKYPTCLMTGSDAGEQCDKMPDPGSYQATVTLLRDDGSAVTNAVSTTHMDVVAGAEVPFPIFFQMPDFLRQDYTGTLDFHATWGSPTNGCAMAKPPVVQESILLRDSSTGMVVPGTTKLGTKLDGTPGPCFTSDNISNTYEEVDGLPWGRYRISVYSATAGFCASVPVFVNPGLFNSTYQITVPMFTPPGQDGGVGDGGTDDGGMSMSDGGAPTCP